MSRISLLLPVLVPIAGSVAALLAGLETVRFYWLEDVPRAIFWLLAAVVIGRWTDRRLEAASSSLRK